MPHTILGADEKKTKQNMVHAFKLLTYLWNMQPQQREHRRTKRRWEKARIKELWQCIFGREEANEKVMISKCRESYNLNSKEEGIQGK